ncbi:hypothetical protein CWE15_02565 [Aliidiomarina taiwanensis]|uniref:YgjV family protein n=1 Tax=Aliidiomarina taiwanensis TaxID=946228 RepID=A0A432X9U0_9GAMM|nr:YgjV family protein [Aliidiomarina taiwanensis]RUO44076.1 hypothetical protein CWE15_02565 [Aliidiomarina taiwanensis]
MEYWIYITGGLAVLTNFIAYRAGTINKYRVIAALALAFLSLHFFLQEALAGAIGIGIGAIRNLVAVRYTNRLVLVVFVAATLGFCLWEWLYLHNPVSLFIAYASALIFTVGAIVLTHVQAIRRWFIVAELLGLLYAFIVGSGLGMLFNLSNLTSIVTKMRSEQQSKTE